MAKKGAKSGFFLPGARRPLFLYLRCDSEARHSITWFDALISSIVPALSLFSNFGLAYGTYPCVDCRKFHVESVRVISIIIIA